VLTLSTVLDHDLEQDKSLDSSGLVLGAGSAAGRLAKKTDGLVTAGTSGIRSIRGESVPRAFTNGMKRMQPMVAAFGLVCAVRKDDLSKLGFESPRSSARIARWEQIYCPIGRASLEVRSIFP